MPQFFSEVYGISECLKNKGVFIGHEHKIRQEIRQNRDLIGTASKLLFLEAVKVQHEENVDTMKKFSM